MIIDIEPMGAPRMTRADAWKERECVLRYRDFKDYVRAVGGPDVARILLEPCLVKFSISMPASWSVKKRDKFRGTPHRQKPDLDNLTKALLDAALPKTDAEVWSLSAFKVWADEGSIEVSLENPF